MPRAARAGGAEIYRNTTVLGIEQRRGGEWLVRTDKGDIVCEHVVSATGNFARQTGAMVGLDVPVIPVEHQYIVTEPHPAIQERKRQGLPEMGVLRESDASYYMREEAGGLLLGPYEKGAPCCYVDGPSAEAEYELFPEDLDRLGTAYRGRNPPRAGLRRGRYQENLQRRHCLHARWRTDRGTGLGLAEFLAQRRPQLRRHCGGRRRLAARASGSSRASPAST